MATDVAARGLDIHSITWVINLDLPSNIEDYVHRYTKMSFHMQSCYFDEIYSELGVPEEPVMLVPRPPSLTKAIDQSYENF